MDAQSDAQLLRTYAESRSDAAFAELVRRYIDLVHSAARRMVGDAHLAEDVTQATFLALAKNAPQLTERPVLAGWLHRTAQNIAAQTVRTDVRRRAREQEAAAMNELLAASPEADWEQIAPHLDAALGDLTEPERDAVMLCYFQRQSARDMAQTLGISDEAAQKRVNRAVDRLREYFAKRGVSVGASGLAVAISAHAVQAAPVGLALTISTAAAMTGTTLATTAIVTATKAIAMTALKKTVIATTIAVLAGAGIYEARQASELRGQNQTLQQQQVLLTERLQNLESENKASANQLALVKENQNRTNNLNELLRLRAEAARLQNEKAGLSSMANDAFAFQAKVLDVLSNTAPVRTFVGTSSITVPWNQTIGLGGWKTPSGKRAFVLATVERGGDSQQVSIRSRILEYTEAGGIELGFRGFNNDEQKLNGTLTLDSKQAAELFDRAQNSTNVSLVSGMTVITASGRQAQIQTVDMHATPSGENYPTGPVLDFVPTVSADGESIHVVMTAQLNYLIPILPTQ